MAALVWLRHYRDVSETALLASHSLSVLHGHILHGYNQIGRAYSTDVSVVTGSEVLYNVIQLR